MKIGIIFDIDGTIWDATNEIADSWIDVLRKKNIDIVLEKEKIIKQMGKVMEEIADDMFSSIPIPERYELLNACCEYENEYLLKHPGKVYPGVEEVFKILYDKYELYIVSNCQKGYIETCMKVNGFNKYIKDTENAGNTGKPKWDNIKMVVERNKLDKAFYIGDTNGDMIASNKAGVPFIHARYGFDTISEDVPFVEKITDVPELLEELLKKDK